ncbi:MAG TPA: hypothetical protein VFR23_26160 [Jiangellaceae bacterium]|nr:hypothetical protein [Jiangellaceae bacterium]
MSPLSFIEFCESVLAVRFEPAQRVYWAVAADDVQLCDLTGDARDIARELFGDIETVPPEARREQVAVKGAGIGWSYFAGLRLLHRALTATSEELGAAGETRVCLAVAPDLRTGRIPVRYALGAAEGVPAIKRLIESSGSDGFTLRREGGRFTSVEALPASIGGRALRGRRYLEALFDESSFFRDSDYAINDTDCRRAVIARTLGKFWNGSTPWLETSEVWKTYQANYGHPTTALAARLPTLTMRSDPDVRRLVEAERERDPDGAAVEYDCQPPAGSGGYFFDGFAIDKSATDALPLIVLSELATRPHWELEGDRYGAGFDPAFQRDASAGVVVRKRAGVFDVCEVFERRPERGQPLVPSVVCREFAAIAKKHTASRICSDIHYQESVKEHLRESGVSFLQAPGGNQGKSDVYNFARDAIHAGRVRWSAGHRRLTQQLREVVARPLPGGLISIQSPRRKGNHGDIASAFCLALWAAEKGSFRYMRLSEAASNCLY